MLGWLQGELSTRSAGSAGRGEAPVEPILIDMRPLKAALLHPEMDRFFESPAPAALRRPGLKPGMTARPLASSGRDLGLRPVDAASACVLRAERTREVENDDSSGFRRCR